MKKRINTISYYRLICLVDATLEMAEKLMYIDDSSDIVGRKNGDKYNVGKKKRGKG